MKCTKFFGHKWSEWEQSYGKPQQRDSKWFAQQLQHRQCVHCGYAQVDWLPMEKEVAAPEGEPTNDQ